MGEIEVIWAVIGFRHSTLCSCRRSLDLCLVAVVGHLAFSLNLVLINSENNIIILQLIVKLRIGI